MAREFCATIDVLYVVPPYYAYDPYGVNEFERIEKEVRASSEQKLAALVLQQVPQGIPAETCVRTGRPATEIVAAAREMDADLIIISTHGHTGLKHVLMGSTAENVVRHAPCPVLTVREKEHEFLA
jgi:universal stress protein A